VITVILYGRPECCLCDEALEVLERVRGRVGFHLEQRDITADDALHRLYLERIPVVELQGEVLFELEVDEAELEARLVRVQAA